MLFEACGFLLRRSDGANDGVSVHEGEEEVRSFVLGVKGVREMLKVLRSR